MISGETWFVSVEGALYGPYTTAQMHAYRLEGRILDHSLVSTNPQIEFRPVSDFAAFAPANPLSPAPWHSPKTQQAPETLGLHPEEPHDDRGGPRFKRERPSKFGRNFGQSFGKRDIQKSEKSPGDAAMLLTQEILDDVPLRPTRPSTHSLTSDMTLKGEDETVILIMAELKTEKTLIFLKALQTCGPTERLGSSVWLIRTPYSSAELRDVLSPSLGETDRLFVMDSYNGKTAWFNIGSDMDSRIRALWGV